MINGIVTILILLISIGLAFYMFLSVKKILKKRKLRRLVLEDGTNDYKGAAKNITNSLIKAKALYRELIEKAHPDRFINDDSKKVLATELSSQITDAKRNYQKLLELKSIVEEKLME